MFALWVLRRFLWMPVNENSIDFVFDSISGKIITFWEHVNVFYESNWEDMKKIWFSSYVLHSQPYKTKTVDLHL